MHLSRRDLPVAVGGGVSAPACVSGPEFRQAFGVRTGKPAQIAVPCGMGQDEIPASRRGGRAGRALHLRERRPCRAITKFHDMIGAVVSLRPFGGAGAGKARIANNCLSIDVERRRRAGRADALANGVGQVFFQQLKRRSVADQQAGGFPRNRIGAIGPGARIADILGKRGNGEPEGSETEQGERGSKRAVKRAVHGLFP